MKISRISFRRILTLASSLALLIGCQSASGPDTPPSTAIKAIGTVEFKDTLRLPDFGVWRTSDASRSDTGRGKVTCAVQASGWYDCSQVFALESILGSARLVQDVYALGVHFATLKYSQTGSTTPLNYLGSDSLVLHAMESKLIHDFNATYQKTPPSDKKPTSADLVAYYVGLLLDGDTTVLTKALPRGMAADSVKKALVQVASQNGITAKVLAAKALMGLTEESIRTITGVLVKAGAKIDTLKLYPPPAVRVVDSVKVASDLTEGEDAVAISGAFAWEVKAAIWKFDYKIVTAGGAKDENIEPKFGKQFEATSGSWVLTKNMTLKAKMGAIIGIDTLITRVFSDSDTVTSRTTFKVLRGDITPPSLTITQPANDTEVSNSTEKINVVAMASDAKGLAEVKIGNVVVYTAPYSTSVDLAVGYNFIVVQAKDLVGNKSVDTVMIRRLKSTSNTDSIIPVVSLRSPQKDTTVPAGVSSFELSWIVTDNAGIKKVTLNDTEVTGTSGAYSKLVSLQDGANVFEIEAFDDAGNPGKKSVTITRTVDVTGPSIVWVAPTANKAVDAAVTSFAVEVKVADPSGVDSVWLNGTLTPKAAGDVYSMTLVLPKPDGNPIRIVVRASDTKGNVTKDSLSVTRSVPDNTDKPVIQLLKPTSATVALPFETDKLHVEADITDPLLAVAAKSVTIGGLVATATGSVYAADVPVPATGKATTITIKAANVNGTTSTLDVVVTRAADETGPALTITSPLDQAEIPYPDRMVDVTATASDAMSGLAKIAIGSESCTISPCAIRNVTPDATGKISVIATDSAGNTTTKSISVVFVKDNSKPIVIWGGSASKEVVVGSSSPGYLATWTVTDNDLDSVTIDKIATTAGSSNTYSKAVAISADKQSINLEAKDKSGNTSTDQLTARLLVAPTITPAGGTFTGGKSVTISAPLGTVEYQIGTGDWTTYTAPISVGSTSSIKARATYGGIIETSAAAAFLISNTTLKSVTVSGIAVEISGNNLTADSLPFLATKVTLSVIPTDTAARVTINNGTSNSVNLVNDTATVSILVTSYSASQTYLLKLAAKMSGAILDRDGNSIRARKMPDGKVWTLQNLWSNPSASSLDPNYNDDSAGCYLDCSTSPKAKFGLKYSWAMSMDKQASCDEFACPIPDSLQHQGLCPSDWHIPTPSEWKNLIMNTGAGVLAVGLPKLLATGESTWRTWEKDGATGNMIFADLSGTDNFGFTLLPNAMNGGAASGYDQAEYLSATTTKIGAYYYPSLVILTPDGISVQKAFQGSTGSVRCVMN